MINQERKPNLEDLLRLKRAERPAPGFWAEFDRELRAKQLAALVEKRPWWRSLPRSLRGLARYHLPLGATAVLAVTLLTIRDYQPVLPAVGGNLSDFEDARVSETAAVDAAYTEGAASEHSEKAVAARATPSHETAAPVTIANATAPSAPGELSRMVPLLSGADVAPTELPPSARSIAENRAVAEAILGMPSPGFEARALPARAMPQEPLAQMSNPAEARRSRFATAFAAAAVSTSPAPAIRVARRLSDEQLYDSIHRFGASGNSVSFKF